MARLAVRVSKTQWKISIPFDGLRRLVGFVFLPVDNEDPAFAESWS